MLWTATPLAIFVLKTSHCAYRTCFSHFHKSFNPDVVILWRDFQTSQGPPKVPEKVFPNPAWHMQKGLPHLTNHSFVIVCTHGHGYSAGLRVGNTPASFSISQRPKNKGCLSVWVAVLGPIWPSLVPDVVIQRLVFCCQVLF